MKKLFTVGLNVLFIFLFITFANGQPAEIRILHVNDFHGFVEPYKPLGSDELLGAFLILPLKPMSFGKKNHPYCFLQET